MATLQVTTTDGGSVVSINEEDVIFVVASGTGSSIRYSTTGFRRDLKVDENPAAVLALADSLYDLQLDGGGSEVIQAKKIIRISGTTNALVEYDDEGAVVARISSSDSYATVKAAVDLLL